MLLVQEWDKFIKHIFCIRYYKSCQSKHNCRFVKITPGALTFCSKWQSTDCSFSSKDHSQVVFKFLEKFYIWIRMFVLKVGKRKGLKKGKQLKKPSHWSRQHFQHERNKKYSASECLGSQASDLLPYQGESSSPTTPAFWETWREQDKGQGGNFGGSDHSSLFLFAVLYVSVKLSSILVVSLFTLHPLQTLVSYPPILWHPRSSRESFLPLLDTNVQINICMVHSRQWSQWREVALAELWSQGLCVTQELVASQQPRWVCPKNRVIVYYIWLTHASGTFQPIAKFPQRPADEWQWGASTWNAGFYLGLQWFWN